MKVEYICDICNQPIYGVLCMYEREKTNYICETIFEFDLCLKCSLSIEKEIRRRIKIKEMAR